MPLAHKNLGQALAAVVRGIDADDASHAHLDVHPVRWSTTMYNATLNAEPHSVLIILSNSVATHTHHYAFAMLTGVVVLVTWFLLSQGG